MSPLSQSGSAKPHRGFNSGTIPKASCRCKRCGTAWTETRGASGSVFGKTKPVPRGRTLNIAVSVAHRAIATNSAIASIDGAKAGSPGFLDELSILRCRNRSSFEPARSRIEGKRTVAPAKIRCHAGRDERNLSHPKTTPQLGCGYLFSQRFRVYEANPSTPLTGQAWHRRCPAKNWSAKRSENQTRRD